MPGMAQGAHRGRPVAAAPCTPGLRPAKSPLRGPFDLSLQASGRAEAASVQNTALSPHPCGLPRPSGNVSAILRPSAPAVSVAQVGKSRTGRTNPVGRISVAPSGTVTGTVPDCPATLRLPGLRERFCGALRYKCTRCSQTTRPVSIANRPFLSASARHVSHGADIPAC